MCAGNWFTISILLLSCLAACRGAERGRALTRNEITLRRAQVIAAATEEVRLPERFQPLTPVDASRSGKVALGRAAERTFALVADDDESAILVVDADAMVEVSRLALDARPGHVLIAPSGLVFVTLASHARVDQLALVDGRLQRVRSTRVAVDPAGMAITKGGALLVASRWGHALSVFDARTLALQREIALARDPYAVELLNDGRALVTHVVGGRVSIVDPTSGHVDVLDASRRDLKQLRRSRKYQMKSEPTGPSGPGIETHRRAVQAFAAARIGDGRVLVSATLADGSPALGGSGYGGGTFSVRTQAGVELAVSADGASVEVPPGTSRFVSDDCLLPRASAWDAESELLIVACAGTKRVIGLGTEGAYAGRLLWARSVDEGPTGLAIDTTQGRWFVWSQHAGTLRAGDLPRPGHSIAVTTIHLAREAPLPENVARGRVLFHRAGNSIKAAGDGRACASCHPDGRDDGITWHTRIGPRQTPILVGRLEDTAPYGWNGRSASLEEHMKITLRRLHSSNLDAREQADILAYVRWLEPPQSPSRGEPMVAKGRELFTAEGRCTTCHPLGNTTDGELHDLGAAAETDRLLMFNTPSLRFIARSAPYYHDGRYASLDALLRDPASGMGSHADLSDDERRALIAFLQTL